MSAWDSSTPPVGSFMSPLLFESWSPYRAFSELRSVRRARTGSLGPMMPCTFLIADFPLTAREMQGTISVRLPQLLYETAQQRISHVSRALLFLQQQHSAVSSPVCDQPIVSPSEAFSKFTGRK